MYYFDHAAKSPMTAAALASYLETAERFKGNPNSLHQAGREAGALLAFCRKKLAASLGCSPEELIFTSGGTESNHLALATLIHNLPATKQEVLVSPLEHPSIYHMLATFATVQVRKLILDRRGIVTPESLAQQLTPQTGLVVIQSVNSVTGLQQPVSALATVAKEQGCWFHCDHVQGLGKIAFPKTVTSCSGAAHKFGGPTGCGLLYLAKEAQLTPIMEGLQQEFGYRGGTPDLPAIVAMTTALLEISDSRWADTTRYRSFQHLLRQAFPTSQLWPDSPSYPGICGIYLPQIKGETALVALDAAGFCVSTTAACHTQRKVDAALIALGLESVGEHYVRISFGPEHQKADILALIAALKELLARS